MIYCKCMNAECSNPHYSYMECDAEVWSWDYFNDQQIDPYWIQCTLGYSHTEHEDENTGLKWGGEVWQVIE